MCKRLRKLVLGLFLIGIILEICHFYNRCNEIWISNVGYVGIENIIAKGNLSDADYMEIFHQTGVSPSVVKKKIGEQDLDGLRELNKLYLNKPNMEHIFVCFPFTTIEYNVEQFTPILDVEDGDILVTFSTSTLDWRHGHCALVLDADKNLTLEHTMLGSLSQYGTVSSWQTQPTFLLLRYTNKDVAERVAEYAKEHLLGLSYNIFVGIDGKKDKGNEENFSSHCSHIVWQAYKQEGVDIDSNGGNIVLPKDIALSEELKVVQVYGLNTGNLEKRLLWE